MTRRARLLLAAALVLGRARDRAQHRLLADFGLPRRALGGAPFSCNLGVEIGQACIVLAVDPTRAWIGSRSPRAGMRVAAWGSACVIAAGAFWFVLRILAA